MKKISIFQIVLLAVFGSLAVAGVLIFAIATSGANNAAGIGPVVIWGTLEGNAFTDMLRTASDADGSLSQVSYVHQDETTYQQNLTHALASGSGPDLFIIRQDYAIADAGEIAPIPYTALSQTQFQTLYVSAADPFLSPGGVLAIPILSDPLVMYWNKDILSSNGFSQPPQYWDELYNMSQTMTKRTDAGSITSATIAFGEYTNVDNAKDIMSMLILQAGGTLTKYDDTGRLLSAMITKSADGTNAAETALRFYTEFADPSKVDYSWNRSLPDARAAFAAGNLALYIGYASEASLIKQTNPNLNFATAPVPQIRGSARSLTIARVYGIAAARAGRNSLNAITAISKLATAGNIMTLASAYQIPAARRDILATSTPGVADLFNKSVIMGESWIDPDTDATASLFQAMIEDTTSGAILLTEAVSRADSQMNHIIGN